MELPPNGFKAALKTGRSQIGLWCSLPGSYAAELLAGAGFDWLLFDTEHSLGDVLTVLPQLQAAAPYPVAPVVRPAANDTVLIKRFLDIGAQTLLIPYIQTPDQAARAVAAMRYPPHGIRGVSALTRATRFGRAEDYVRRAEEELCLLVQIETGDGARPPRGDRLGRRRRWHLHRLRPTWPPASATRGADGHPAVVAAVEDAVTRIVALGKPAGILTPDPDFARRCVELGTTFTAVGVDADILARTSEKLAASFRVQ